MADAQLNIQNLSVLEETIAREIGGVVTSTEIIREELVLNVKRENIVKVLIFLRDDVNCQFKMLMELCGVDYPERENRFDIVYCLLSLTLNQRIRVKTQTNVDMAVPSVAGIFSSANWWEREAWDLFGIYFSDHPDLRRILTDYGFQGYPLRKDFPLTGHYEVRYDEDKKKVVSETVKLDQEYRDFDFESPWEGTKYISKEVNKNEKKED